MTPPASRFAIGIRSLNRFREFEWTSTVVAGSCGAAARKAFHVIRGAGVQQPAKRSRVGNDLERWEI